VLAALAVVVTLNVAASVTPKLPFVRAFTPGSDRYTDVIDPWTFTLLSDRGWNVGFPQADDTVQELLASAEDAGYQTIEADIRQPAYWGMDPLGVAVVASEYGLTETSTTGGARPDVVFRTWQTEDPRLLHGLEFEFGRPCPGTFSEGANAPLSAEPVTMRYLVKRRQPNGKLRRWCDFQDLRKGSAP
jgi:hypothetical protein